MRKRNSVYLFEYATMDLVKDFAKKQGLTFDGFVGDNPTGAVEFGGDIFSVDEIYYDLKTEQPKGKIFEYDDFCTKVWAYNRGVKKKEQLAIPNYQSYCMGIAETEKYKIVFSG